jgi:hypothetical protein
MVAGPFAEVMPVAPGAPMPTIADTSGFMNQCSGPAPVAASTGTVTARASIQASKFSDIGRPLALSALEVERIRVGASRLPLLIRREELEPGSDSIRTDMVLARRRSKHRRAQLNGRCVELRHVKPADML